MYVVDPL